jgi:hypothetical protein
MDGTIAGWLDLSRDELDELYKNAQPGPIPQGDTQGTAIAWALPFPREFAQLAKRVAWQGKVFELNADGETGVLRNKILPFGVKLIVARVYREASWLDGKETIVIDYTSTSVLAQKIRDEIREITPGHYLGKVWWGEQRILDFALEAPEKAATQSVSSVKAVASKTKSKQKDAA